MPGLLSGQSNELHCHVQVGREVVFDGFFVDSVEDAHEGLDDRLLEYFCVVDVGDGEDSFAAEVEDVHDSFEVFSAEVAALEEEFSNAHEYV